MEDIVKAYRIKHLYRLSGSRKSRVKWDWRSREVEESTTQ